MSLAKKTVGSLVWTISEKVGFALIQFLVLLVLARLLSPADFGLIATLSIFISLSRTLIDSGFSQALIRTNDVSRADYDSVFFVNIGIGLFVYGVIFISAPWIARFYDQPQLVDIARVLSLVFVISSFSIVQNTILVKNLEFKKILIIRLPSLLIGGLTGIIMAYNGWGVWSLVWQQIITQLMNTLQFMISAHWMPSLKIKFERLKVFFSFGSNLMFSGILDVLFANLDTLLIGKLFSIQEVGFYQRAKSTRQLPIDALGSALNSVTFPLLSSIQNDHARLKSGYSRIITQAFYLLTPILISFAILGTPLFRILFTEKWVPAVTYFQWLCLAGVFQIVNSYNLNILKVKGESGLFLRLNIFRKSVQVVVMIAAVQFDILMLVRALLVLEILMYFLNSYICGRKIDYTITEQVKDLSGVIVLNFLLGIFLYFAVRFYAPTDFWDLILYVLAGGTFYFGLSYAVRLKELTGLIHAYKSKAL